MIRTKDSVDHRKLTTQALLALIRADQIQLSEFLEVLVSRIAHLENVAGVFEEFIPVPVVPQSWVTSISDGAAGRVPNSKHPTGDAIDLSVKGHPDPKKWADTIRRALGPQYDVVLHDSGSGLHIHIEFDPKEGRS